MPADVQARALGRGLNAFGFDPLWRDLAKRRVQPEHFRRIKAAAFATVRVSLFAFDHLDAANRLDPAWLARVDWVVELGGGDSRVLDVAGNLALWGRGWK